jgi:DNA polymerase-1
MGGAKLAHGLNLPTEFKFIARLNKEIEVAGPEAQAILDGFNRGVPFVRELNDLCQDAVRARGRIRTILGRHLHFEAQTDPGRLARGETHDKIHKALNRLIQGSCADQAKCSIVLIEEAGHELQLQMHDEMDLSVNDEAEARKVAEIMSNSIPLRVPMKVDVEIGPSWGGSMS